MTINMKTLRLLLIFFLIGSSANAQDAEVITQIKNQFAAINKVLPTALKKSIDNVTYFIIDNKIVKANLRTDSLNYEFYYKNETSGQFFFVMSTKERSNRYYFEREDLIKWMEDKKEINSTDQRWPYYSRFLFNLAADLKVIYRNFIQNQANKLYAEKVTSIDYLIDSIDRLKTKVDTVSKTINKAELYWEWEFAYYDANNKRVKSMRKIATDHGESEALTYYVNGKTICEIERRHSWSGTSEWYNETLYYYEKDNVFRKIFKVRSSANNGRLIYSFVDEIQDN